MEIAALDRDARKRLLQMQLAEITESLIYSRLAETIKDEVNRHIVSDIARDEERHAAILQSYTKETVKPNMLKARWYALLAKALGFTFAIKIMERGEGQARDAYKKLSETIPEVQSIMLEEEKHEEHLIGMLDEDRLKFVGSIVLGMNDALVELTGALAGLTLAFNDMKIMVLAGLVTGISAALSMAASEYLSARADNEPKALRRALYTGATYLLTVALLVLPYLLFVGSANPAVDKWIAIGIMIGIVILIVAAFNFYLSVVRDYNFKKRFLEMAAISVGVAGLSFLVSMLLSMALGI